MTSITGILHEDQYTFLMTARSVFLRMGNISDKFAKEQNQLVAKYFPPLFVVRPPTCFGEIFLPSAGSYMQHFSNSELSHVVTTVVVFTIIEVITIGLWLKKL